MKEKLLHSFLKVGNFILEELPFIVIFVFCMCLNTLKDSIFNYGGCNLKYYSISFLLSVIFSCITRKNIFLKTIFYFITVFFFAVYMFLWLVFGTSISPLIVQLIVETNGRESSEFFSAFVFSKGAIITYVSVIVLITIIVFFERLWKKIREKKWLKRKFLVFIFGIISVFLLIAGIFSSKLYYTLYKCQTYADLESWVIENIPFPMDSFTSTAYSIHALEATKNEIKIAVNLAKDIYRQPVTDEVNDSINIIYVLGESFIKSHASLYGYKKKIWIQKSIKAILWLSVMLWLHLILQHWWRKTHFVVIV